MKLMDFNCDKCGAHVEKIDSKNYVYECKYCGYKKKINDNYIIKEYSTNGARPIEFEIEERIKRAEQVLNVYKDYYQAYNMFLEIYQDARGNPRVLEGLIRSYSWDFDHLRVSNYFETFRKNMYLYLDRYEKIEPNKFKVKEYRDKLDDMEELYYASNGGDFGMAYFAFGMIVFIWFLLIISTFSQI